MDKPKYNIRDVIDLRFNHNSMPDRIYIRMVYMKDKSTEWMYEVFSEKSDCIIYMSESQINMRISKKDGKCYENDMIKGLYRDGFRFCGNNKRDTAISRANNMVNANYIKHIILADALDKDGNEIDGYLGLWVQYNTVIDEDERNKMSEYHIIK